MLPTITKLSIEWRYVWLLAVVTALLTTVPYLIGAVVSPGHYTGSTYTNFGDTAQYYSYLNQVIAGQGVIDNVYTTEASRIFLFRPFFLVLGTLARLFALPAAVIFQLGRMVFGALLISATYRLLTVMAVERTVRLVAITMLALGAGFGGLLHPFFFREVQVVGHVELFTQFPADLYLSESSFFLTILHSPLLPFALLVDVLVLTWFFKPSSKRWQLPVLVILIFLFGFDHPFDLLALLIVAASALGALYVRAIVIRQPDRLLWVYLKKFAALLVGVLASAGYYWWLVSHRPAFTALSAQNLTESPALASLLLGYGLFIPLAGVGLVVMWRQKNLLVFGLWALSLWVIAYTPFQYQRRVLPLALIPLAVVASAGAVAGFRWLKKYSQRGAITATIIAAALLASTNAVVIAAHYPLLRLGYYSITFEQQQALGWLSRQPKAVVLASPYISNIITGESLHRVYVGHIIQTTNYADKVQEVTEWFYKTNNDDAQKSAWLQQRHIDYVWVGSDERSLGAYQAATKDYLRPVYRSAEVTIYQPL